MTMPLTLLSVCEDMFQLNVLNRVKRNQYHYLTYHLKNAMIKYLYEQGRCTEALLHCQKFGCWSCDGSGEIFTGETCYKCGGTGVFREVWHYAFRFEIQGRRFSWHQPKTMVDFPVMLTPGLHQLYTDPALPAKDDLNLFYRRADRAVWNVALFLWLRGQVSLKLGELPFTSKYYWNIKRFYCQHIELNKDTFRLRLRSWLFGEPYDEPPF